MNETQATAVKGATGGGGGLGIGVLIVWLLGHFGVQDITAEVGTVIGGLALSGGAAIGTYGIFGCCNKILFGNTTRARKTNPAG